MPVLLLLGLQIRTSPSGRLKVETLLGFLRATGTEEHHRLIVELPHMNFVTGAGIIVGDDVANGVPSRVVPGDRPIRGHGVITLNM